MMLEPNIKKARFEDPVGSRQLGKLIPRAVLADEYTRRFETVEMFAADIKDRSQTSELIRKLNDTFPLNKYGHLKRVRCVKAEKDSVIQIILCVKEGNLNSDVTLRELLEQKDIKTDTLGQPFVVQVAKHQPLTREQFTQASTCWPVNFHEDKYISKVLKGELFSDTDVHFIEKYMRMAINAAKKSDSQEFAAGAIIVNPQTNHPIAVSHDLRCTGHPLQHAVMLCIDLVAHWQSSGAWQLNCQVISGTWTLKDSCQGRKKQNLNLVDDDSFNGCNSSDSRTLPHDEDSFSSNKACNLPSGTEKKCNSQPYLCTGYDLYVTREPCVMCAMALLHSRIRRVFYGCSDNVMGALGSRYKIHTQTGLNHHFEVFCDILEDECNLS
ncbi:probable inactive tRNA-specific adenosine deaminase-like protein 3 isoform X1 [Montipora foliosa]|uniref:probable inactive tRNA-specific adenosine deaminase-like protein 3 isoform X1 n=2 Tax=Montipora foliosa TaxID=591990 RepID=UPI0035F1B801